MLGGSAVLEMLRSASEAAVSLSQMATIRFAIPAAANARTIFSSAPTLPSGRRS